MFKRVYKGEFYIYITVIFIIMIIKIIEFSFVSTGEAVLFFFTF